MSPKSKILIPVQKTKCNAVTSFHIFDIFQIQAFIQALLAMAVFPQRFTFSQKYSLHIIHVFVKHDFFFCKYYGLVINLHEIDHTGPYGTGYQRNGIFLCTVNEYGLNSYKRLVPDFQDWP